MESVSPSHLPDDASLSHGGVFVNLVKAFPSGQAFIPIVSIILLSSVYIGLSLLSPSQDGREPPLLKPKVPFFGHFLGLMREQTTFLPSLSRFNIPIATLPILTGKTYAVWDANLIQAVYRNKNLSFDPILVGNARGALGLDEETHKIIAQDDLIHEISESIHKSMATSEVRRMNTNALKYVSAELDKLSTSDVVEIPNLYYWLRNLMTIAACEAVYGPGNPILSPELIDDIWIWDDYLTLLVINIFPSVTARKGYQARNRLQAALSKYYSAHGDAHKDASGLARGRADVLRKHGITDEMIGVIEVALLHVATINTVPVLFWLLTFVITRPRVTESLRKELATVPVFDSDNTATVDMDSLAEKCPLLISSYKEALRLCDSVQVARRVLSETTISDSKGKTYLLKKGLDVQLPSDHLNKRESIWGPDAAEFRAERFLDSEHSGSEAARTRRMSYNPFGGGKHICPGRNFAQAENLGFMISFLLSYDIMPVDGNWDNFKAPEMDKPPMTTPICRPINDGEGFGIKIQRRSGWENITWKMTSGREV